MYRAAACFVLLLCSGCWSSIENNCRSCRIIDRTTAATATRPETRTLVVLVHGAFGFGTEWRRVLDELRAERETEFVAYRWSGGWNGLYGPAAQLAVELQRMIDHASPTLSQIVVIAHSAGGVIGQIAATRLRVPRGLRLTVVSIAAPSYLRIAPFVDEPEVNTPLGLAVTDNRVRLAGARLDDTLPPRVTVLDYVVGDPRRRRRDDGRLFVGAHAGHMRSLATVAVPLLQQAATRQSARPPTLHARAP